MRYQCDDKKGKAMNWNKLGTSLVSALFPAAGLYFCWWLMGEAGELVAGLVFGVLCVNYFLIMRKLKR